MSCTPSSQAHQIVAVSRNVTDKHEKSESGPFLAALTPGLYRYGCVLHRPALTTASFTLLRDRHERTPVGWRKESCVEARRAGL